MADNKRKKLTKDKGESPEDGLKAQQEWIKNQAEIKARQAAEANANASGEQEAAPVAEVIKAAQEKQQQAETAAAAVLELQPTEPIEESADAAIIEKNAEQVQGLVATTEERLADVTTSVESNPAPIEPTPERPPMSVESEADLARMTDMQNRVNTQFKTYAGIIRDLSQVDPKFKLGDAYRDFVANETRTTYDILYRKNQGEVTAADAAREFEDILKRGEERMRIVRKIIETAKAPKPPVPPLENSNVAPIPEAPLPEPLLNSETTAPLTTDTQIHVVETPVNQQPPLTENQPNPAPTEPRKTTEKKIMTLTEWENNRRAYISQLTQSAPVGEQEPGYQQWHHHVVDEKLFNWESRNPKPIGEVPTTTPTIDFERMVADAEREAAGTTAPTNHETAPPPAPETIISAGEKEEIRLRAAIVSAKIGEFNQLYEDNKDLINPRMRQKLLDIKARFEERLKKATEKLKPNETLDILTVLQIEIEEDYETYNSIMFVWHNQWEEQQANEPAVESTVEPAETPAPAVEETEPIVEDNATPPPIPKPKRKPKATKAENQPNIRNISNQTQLRELLAKTSRTEGRILTEDEIKATAAAQAEFVKSSKVEELIMKGSQTIKDIFSPEGKKTISQEALRKELLATLLDSKSLDHQTKQKLLANQLAKETGLTLEQAEDLISNQEERLRKLALIEINAGRLADVTTADEASTNIAAARKAKLTKFGVYLGIGAGVGAAALLTGATAGIGTVATIAGARVVDNFVTDRRQKKLVDAKYAKMRAALEADPDSREAFLKQFFTEAAITQQKRINGNRKFVFNDFIKDNDELLADVEVEKRADIIKSLSTLQKIDQKTFEKEMTAIEGLSDKIKRSDSRILKFPQKVTSAISGFMVKGGGNNYQRAFTAVLLGLGTIAAREMWITRVPMAMWTAERAFKAIGEKKWGNNDYEAMKITDNDTPESLALKLQTLKDSALSDKQKKDLLKYGGMITVGLAAALAPTIGHVAMDYIHSHWGTPIEAGTPTSPNVAAAAVEQAHPTGAAAAVIEAPKVNPLADAIKEMRGVHGDKSPHLWGLIDKKVDTLINHLHAPSISDGRETHIIDNIKDQIAKNPELFGLHKGANIDILTPADLEKISQNDHFNEVIGGMFNKESFAEQASNLSAEAVKHIEANNAFNQQVVEHLPKGIHLNQQAYDTMSQLHNQGLSADAAAHALQQSQEAAIHAANATGHIPDNLPVGPLRTEHLMTGTGGTSETLATTGVEQVTAPTSEIFPLPTNVESYQDSATMSEWQKVTDLMANTHNERGIGKSLDSIFRHFGVAKEYSAADAADFAVKNISYKGGELNFDVPPPINHLAAEQLGDMHFSFNAAKNEMMGYVGDESVSLKNIKNVDKGIKTIFTILTDKVR